MSRLVDHWEQTRFVYVISPEIYEEVRQVIQRPRLRARMSVDPAILLVLLEQDTEWVAGDLRLPGACRDPKDDKFIACAVEGGADYLVTGDSDLLDIERYETVQMIRAYDFVQMVDKGME